MALACYILCSCVWDPAVGALLRVSLLCQDQDVPNKGSVECWNLNQ
jgi:hypothetical protein